MGKFNIHLIWVLKGEERQYGVKTVSDKVIAGNFPELVKKTKSVSRRPKNPKPNKKKKFILTTHSSLLQKIEMKIKS